jgi:hypothetical protein
MPRARNCPAARPTSARGDPSHEVERPGVVAPGAQLPRRLDRLGGHARRLVPPASPEQGLAQVRQDHGEAVPHADRLRRGHGLFQERHRRVDPPAPRIGGAERRRDPGEVDGEGTLLAQLAGLLEERDGPPEVSLAEVQAPEAVVRPHPLLGAVRRLGEPHPLLGPRDALGVLPHPGEAQREPRVVTNPLRGRRPPLPLVSRGSRRRARAWVRDGDPGTPSLGVRRGGPSPTFGNSRGSAPARSLPWSLRSRRGESEDGETGGEVRT